MKELEYVSVDDVCVGESEDGPFRSYHLQAEGRTMEELLADAHIFEIDQDGGSVRDNPASDYSNKVYTVCELVLARALKERDES